MSDVKKIYIKGSSIYFENVLGKTRTLNMEAFHMLPVGNKWLDSLKNYLTGYRTTTIASVLVKLNQIIGAPIKQILPQLADLEQLNWQNTLFQIYEIHMNGQLQNSKIENRIKDWNSVVVPFLTFIKDEAGLIPMHVQIPRVRKRSSKVFFEGVGLLGENDPVPVEDQPIDKILVKISSLRNDQEYFEEIRDQLAFRRRVLHDCLLDWWNQINSHFKYGRELIENTNWIFLKHKIFSGQAYVEGKTAGINKWNWHISDGKTPEKLGNYLCIRRNIFQNQVSRPKKKNVNRHLHHIIMNLPENAPTTVSEIITKSQRLNWMLGNLSTMDIAVCMALLIMHNPSFTPYSILYAKLKDKHGRPFLEKTENGIQFRLEKARAKKMKSEVLDNLSLEIIETIKMMTDFPREKLKEENPEIANCLFLHHYWGKYSVPSPDRVGKKISGGKESVDNEWLGYYFPILEKSGLTRGGMSFSRIRATEGVLEWFRTGSVSLMAKILGNSSRVALNHYLPAPLLDAFNARLIRRFQNLWLAAAAAGESFLLEVTDFYRLEDLHAFLGEMLLQNSSTSSPLAKEIHRKFSFLSEPDLSGGIGVLKGSLTVPVAVNSLAAIYLYHSSAIEAGVDPALLDIEDVYTKIRPRQIICLAELLKHNLPNHHDKSIRVAHSKALDVSENIRKNHGWGSLFLMKESFYE